MNRETTLHFGHVPKIHQKRSKFNMSNSIKTTFNVGQVIPVQVWEVLPGDTVEMDMSEIVRMATPIYPVMDNMVLDIMYYYVPTRLTWTHWPEFWGENEDPWTQSIEYEIPQLEAPSGGWTEGTIADYLGIPTLIDDISVNALPFRGYAKICSDWFRNENTDYVCHMYDDETTRTGSNGTNYVTDIELGGMPYVASKMHDYFTSALPAPQKGDSVLLPLGQGAPVYSTADIHTFDLPNAGLHFRKTNGQALTVAENLGTTNEGYTATFTNIGPGDYDITVAPDNLWTDLSRATAATINQLRTAFAIQKFLEAAGRFGTRYIEFLRGIFGVESSDARLQRSEYIGGKRFPINMEQILQTSSTDAVTPQGNASGFSVTIHKDSMFTKSFEEHGFLYCLVVARVEHSYQQGIDRMFSRKKFTDFYNPFFANLGEMPILNKEIYMQGESVVDSGGSIVDNQVFGYQEAWADYRYRPNRVTGAMRSNATSGSLDAWHYADDYKSLPTLTRDWMQEPTENVDRTIAVSSELTHQMFADFYFKCSFTRCMPVYSVPGLIDHV